jgi:hypothetical protein
MAIITGERLWMLRNQGAASLHENCGTRNPWCGRVPRIKLYQLMLRRCHDEQQRQLAAERELTSFRLPIEVQRRPSFPSGSSPRSSANCCPLPESSTTQRWYLTLPIVGVKRQVHMLVELISDSLVAPGRVCSG